MDQFTTSSKHQTMVSALVKPGEDILKELSPSDCNIWHLSSALCGEAGELFDAVKKAVIYRKDISLDNVIEELGDIEFYLEGLRQALSITREYTLAANIDKLSVRYAAKKFTNEAAQQRADKND